MKNDIAILSWLGRQTGRRLPAIFLMTVMDVCRALLGVAFALGTKGVINSAIDGNSRDLLRAALIQFAIILGILVCLTVYRYLRARLGAVLERDWKQTFVHKILSGDYASLSEYHTSMPWPRFLNRACMSHSGYCFTTCALSPVRNATKEI